MKKLTESSPEVIACDCHPTYYSTRVADELTGVRVIRVQHHHAHIVSCLAENQISGDVIGSPWMARASALTAMPGVGIFLSRTKQNLSVWDISSILFYPAVRKRSMSPGE